MTKNQKHQFSVDLARRVYHGDLTKTAANMVIMLLNNALYPANKVNAPSGDLWFVSITTMQETLERNLNRALIEGAWLESQISED